MSITRVPLEINRLHGDGVRVSRVQGAALLRTVIFSLLYTHATVLLDPDGTSDTRHDVPLGAGFSILLVDLLPYLNNYGAVSSFRRVRTALWPAGFPVYASSMLFRQPTGAMPCRIFVGIAVPPAVFPDLANINATLGSDYWLGSITTGLSPDKKRLALLGAQQFIDSVNYPGIRSPEFGGLGRTSFPIVLATRVSAVSCETRSNREDFLELYFAELIHTRVVERFQVRETLEAVCLAHDPSRITRTGSGSPLLPGPLPFHSISSERSSGSSWLSLRWTGQRTSVFPSITASGLSDARIPRAKAS